MVKKITTNNKKSRSRSPEKKAAQFESIIEECEKIIIENGIDNFSLRKLAKRLGMNQSNLFNYVSNKRELVLAIRNKYFDMLKSENQKIKRSIKSPFEALIKIFENFLDFACRNDPFFDMMFLDGIPSSKEPGKIELGYNPNLLMGGTSRLIKKGIDSGEIVNKDPYKLAYLTYTMLLGAAKGERFLAAFELIEGYEGAAISENIDIYDFKLGSLEFRKYVIIEIRELLRKK